MTWSAPAPWRAPTGAPPLPPEPEAPSAEPKRLSASQIDLAFDCLRKWAFKYLEKVPEAEKSSTILGSAVHRVAEDWLKHRTEPDVTKPLHLPKGRGAPGENVFYPGQIFLAGRHALPEPGTVHVEGAKKWETPRARWRGQLDGLTVRLGSDTLYPYDSIADAQRPVRLAGARLEVWDHKTTSDFRYVKGPVASKDQISLLDDVQANLYAYASMLEFGVEQVDARWLYYRTRGRPDSRLTAVTFTRSHVDSQIEKIDSKAVEVYTLYQLRPQVRDLPPNTSSCDKYGGCDYRSICPLSISQRFASLSPSASSTSGQKMNQPVETFEQLLARARAAQGQPVPPPASQPAAPPPTPAPSAPPPTPAPIAAAKWRPGSPLNPTQEWMLSQPATTWAALCQAVDSENAPSAGEAGAWDAFLESPHKTGGILVARPGVDVKALQSMGLPVQAPVLASASAPPGALTVGINPPEAAGKIAPSRPEEIPPRIQTTEVAQANVGVATPGAAAPGSADPSSADPYDGMTREMLKALCVQKGLCATSCAKRDVEVFKQALRTGVAIPEAGESKAPPVVPAAPPSAPPPAPSAPPPPPPPPVAAPVASGELAPAPSTAYKGGYTLYVNCTPTRSPTVRRLVSLSELATVVAEQVRQVAGVPHYKMIDFGKGAGLYSGLLEELIKSQALGPDVGVYVDTRTNEGADALAVLERYAGPVIRGL